jgi:hypothetical protein
MSADRTAVACRPPAWAGLRPPTVEVGPRHRWVDRPWRGRRPRRCRAPRNVLSRRSRGQHLQHRADRTCSGQASWWANATGNSSPAHNGPARPWSASPAQGTRYPMHGGFGASDGSSALPARSRRDTGPGASGRQNPVCADQTATLGGIEVVVRAGAVSVTERLGSMIFRIIEVVQLLEVLWLLSSVVRSGMPGMIATPPTRLMRRGLPNFGVREPPADRDREHRPI